MKLEQSFEVAAPLERVWAALIDVERVAPCLPGAAVTGRNDDGSYNGEFKVKIGPTTASYSGSSRCATSTRRPTRPRCTRTAPTSAGRAAPPPRSSSRVGRTRTARTRVDVVTDFPITGRLARFGRGGMIEDISKKLLREFASCLQTSSRPSRRRPSVLRPSQRRLRPPCPSPRPRSRSPRPPCPSPRLRCPNPRPRSAR